MSLTGLPDNRRTPGIAREFVFAAGPGSSGTSLDILLYGNKTSAGSETTEVIKTAILDRNDAMARFGRRSELFHMWRLANAGDPFARIYAIVVPEGGSATAATRTVAFATNASGTTTRRIEFQGEYVEYTVSTGDTPTTQGDNFVTAFNNASEGTWQATAANVTGTVTITAAQLGVRGGQLLGNSLRVTDKDNVSTTTTLGSLTAGTVEDDFTNAYAAAAAGYFYYQVNPKYATTAPTTSDNGVGEGVAYLRSQNLPVNGKEQLMHFAFIGTQGQATTVATDADVNTTLGHIYRAENSPWSTAMIAAHMTGVKRSKQVPYPAYNFAGYRASDTNTMLGPPDPLDKNDRPTPTEIEADLANGITPIAFDANGSPYIPREINTYSEISAGVKDYRASEGHTAPCIHAVWREIFARWDQEKQPNIIDDLPAGAKPIPLTSTPADVRALLNWAIDEFSGPRPLGKYPGPLLSSSPADMQAMRDSVTAYKRAGGIAASCDFKVVEHLLFSEFKIRQTNTAYLWCDAARDGERWWHEPVEDVQAFGFKVEG